MFSKKSIIVLAAVAIAVKADHSFNLVNNCNSEINMSIDTWSGTSYTGPQPPTIAPHSSWNTVIPNGWDGRICYNRNCWSGGSITEYNLVNDNSGWYDISNIQGFTIGQQIQAQGGETVTCQSASCDCTQAYAPGNMGGTCPGSTAPDRPVRTTGTVNAAFTVVYCP